MNVRKTGIIRETVETDAHGKKCDPIVRVCAFAVVKNPAAGPDFTDDLSALFDIGGRMGDQLMGEIVGMLGRAPVSYGKAALVGVNGDMEHGGAFIHPKLGKPMRASVGGGQSVIPSNVKIAGPGAIMDIPLGHKDEAWSFDHFDTMTVMIADAPLPDEAVILMAVADGGRPVPRVGTGPITD